MLVTVIEVFNEEVSILGQPQKVNVTFRRVLDYPLDLYYVMDLSYSMRDDLQTLQVIGSFILILQCIFW